MKEINSACMQILRGEIYLLALLLPFNVLLKCKNIELAIIVAFGLLLMTPKESLAVILSTASSTNLSIMQNVDETKQQLLHYEISNSSTNINPNGNKSTSATTGGLIRCSNKLKCFDLNSTALRMRNGGGQLLNRKDNFYYDSGNNLYEGKNNHIEKFNLRHIRTRRDHETNVIDTPSTLHQQQHQEKLMKTISQLASNSTSNHKANNQRNGSNEDLIKWNSLSDLQKSNTTRQGNETSVDNTHSSYNGEGFFFFDF